MNHKILIFLAFLLSLVACNDDKETLLLKLDNQSVRFETPAVAKHTIGVKTNLKNISIYVPSENREWLSVELNGNELVVVVKENKTFDQRSAVISLNGEGVDEVNVLIVQPGRDGIKSFSIKSSLNDIKNDIVGVVNHENNSITIATKEFVANVRNVKVTFESTSPVYVNNSRLISEETGISLLDDNKLVCRSGSGIETVYNLVCEGPMFTGLPVISVDIEDGKEVVEKVDKLPASFSMFDPASDSNDMKGVTSTIRGRGNTTWSMPKKPYRIDFAEKTSLFGLTEAKKWVLLANYQDPTLMMNDVAFDLGRRLGLQFTHSSHHVELFINGTYRGNYQLTEQKEIGAGRVDIDKKKGFLVEFDVYYDEDYKFRSTYLNLPVMVADPSLKSQAEMEYIKVAIQGLENSLFEDGFPNDSYENHTDVNSLIDYMLVNEIVRNQELLHPKSTLCYRDAGGKIKWGPLWDFDWAFGYDEVSRYFKKTDILFYPGNYYDRPGGKFFGRFMEIPGFKEKYKKRWIEIKPVVEGIYAYIDMMGAKLGKSQGENFKISKNVPVEKNLTHAQLLEQMKVWLKNRINNLDTQIRKL